MSQRVTGLSDHRAAARRLLKQFRSNDGAAAIEAAERFRRLRSFGERSAAELLSERDHVQLKHALAVIAVEQGHSSWTALKAAAESSTHTTKWYARGMDVFLNRWFRSYEEAHASREADGGYLFPYRHQFFVCAAEAVTLLRLDPVDPDWERVGWDCARPKDRAAFDRLEAAAGRARAREESGGGGD